MDARAPSILLVGNGRSLLSRRGFGAVVDGFDRIVRFNDFLIGGFEAYVGTRTDWWAKNESPPYWPRREAFERIFLRPEMESAAGYAASSRAALAELALSHAGTPVELIPEALHEGLKARYGFRNSALTGTLVAAHLLARYPRVHVCGFDGLGGSPETRRHYFDDANTVEEWATYHDSDADARFLRDRANEGRLVFV